MKAILDACCGSRMFWFDRRHPDVVFMDRREETHMLCDGRTLEIKPDVVGDFRADLKKPFRVYPQNGMGQARYYTASLGSSRKMTCRNDGACCMSSMADGFG